MLIINDEESGQKTLISLNLFIAIPTDDFDRIVILITLASPTRSFIVADKKDTN